MYMTSYTKYHSPSEQWRMHRGLQVSLAPAFSDTVSLCYVLCHCWNLQTASLFLVALCER